MRPPDGRLTGSWRLSSCPSRWGVTESAYNRVSRQPHHPPLGANHHECDKAAASTTVSPRGPVASTYLQVSDIKRLLENVGSVGSGGEPPHVGQVAAVAPHGLDDEHTALGPAGRLLDAVTRLATEKDTGYSGGGRPGLGHTDRLQTPAPPCPRWVCSQSLRPDTAHRGGPGTSSLQLPTQPHGMWAPTGFMGSVGMPAGLVLLKSSP